MQEPFVSIAVADGSNKVGQFLLQILGQSQTAVSNEEYTQLYIAQIFANMLTAIGVSSVDELVETTRHCGVGVVNGRYELTPTQKGTT